MIILFEAGAIALNLDTQSKSTISKGIIEYNKLEIHPVLQKKIVVPEIPLVLATDVKNKTVELQGSPTVLSIPSLSLSLNILEGGNLGEAWTISDSNVHFDTATYEPNTSMGNTLIYGHNIPNVLRKTENLKPKDILIIKTENNLVFEYSFREFEYVVPTDTNILFYAGPSQVTLLTCNNDDSLRKLMYFDFVQVRKI